MSAENEKLKAQVQEYEKYGAKFQKAIDAVLAGGVKEARFLPSGRRIYSVVGRLGDEFLDPERPYCSCSNFFFRVQGGKEEICYHLISYKIAKKTGKIDTIDFSDDDYSSYLSATMSDVFEVLGEKGG